MRDMTEVTQPEKPLVKAMIVEKGSISSSAKRAAAIVGILLVGVVSGWVMTNLLKGPGGISSGKIVSSDTVSQSGVKVGDVVGATDERPFKDTTEGVLVEGGANGEGSYHLLRPGGPSKNVYLTSSTIDLSLFIGHRVQVWGETFSAQRAGWLMDVGRIKALELNATPPFEE